MTEAGSAGSAGSAPVRRSRSALDPAAPALAIVAESAWISVVAALVQAFVQERAILGVVGLVPFVAAGLLIARAFGARLGSRWPATAVALTLVSAAAGWLVSPTVREALVGGDLSRALGDHADGWLAGLAMLRGFAHAGPLRSEESLAGLLGIGTPALAGVALLGGAVAEPWRGWFIADAIAGVILFLGTGILGLTIARMSSLGIASGFDWRRNRTWLALLLFLVVAIAGVALPGAFVVGAAIPIAVGLLAVPLLVVGAIAGFGYTSRRALASVFLLGIVLIAIAAIGGETLSQVTPPEPTGGGEGQATNQALVGAAAGGIALLLVVLAILILARLWMREIRVPVESDVPEERTIDYGGSERPLPRRPRGQVRNRRPDPTEAVGAYVALVEDLATRGDAARFEAETPAEHARRLRGRDLGGLGLALLAADYELAQFGGVSLSPAEHRRAVSRWRRLRGLVGGTPKR